MFLDRAVYYQELAEKAAMEQVAMDLRSSVNLRVAELALENRFSELPALASQNPMELLVRKPQNYLGVLTKTDAAHSPPGGWYYDNGSKEVVYYVDLGRYFTPDAQGRKRVAWRVALTAGTAAKAGEPGWGPQWARLELVQPYRWF